MNAADQAIEKIRAVRHRIAETAMAKRNPTGAPGTKEVAKQLARWREQYL